MRTRIISQKAEKGKVDKYFPCLNELKPKYGLEEGEMLPVVLGSIGAITTKIKEILYEFGSNNSEIKTIIMNVLRSSIEICNIFLDG
jgi:hypothetical protein